MEPSKQRWIVITPTETQICESGPDLEYETLEETVFQVNSVCVCVFMYQVTSEQSGMKS